MSRGWRRGQSAKVEVHVILLVSISLDRAGRWSLNGVEEGLEGDKEQVPRLGAASVGFLRCYYLSVVTDLRCRYRYLHLFFFQKEKKKGMW